MQGPHAHEWHYGEPQYTVIINKPRLYWYAMRYCETCHLIEKVELHEKA